MKNYFHINMKKAYLIEGWSSELKEGYASELIIEKSWSTIDRVMFTVDKKVYSFEPLGKTEFDKGVFFDLEQANKAVEHQKSKYIEYLKMEVLEKQKTIKQLEK
jgi:hypothetical protein